MKNKLFIQDSLANKITYYHIIAFLVCLPFERFYSELALISLTVHSVFQINFSKLKTIQIRYVWLLISLYLLTLATTFYSIDKNQAFAEWGKQQSLLLFPLIFLLNPIDLRKYKDSFFFFFSLSCVLTIGYLYTEALLNISKKGASFTELFSPAYINHNFAIPLEAHATYLSMFFSLALSYIIIKTFQTAEFWKRGIGIVLAVILLLGLIQLASKAVMIATLLFLNICLPFLFIKTIKKWKTLIVTASLTIAAIIALFKIDTFKERYFSQLKTDIAKSYQKDEAIEPRALRWEAALELVKKAPIVGYGAGSETKMLKEVYFEKKYYNSYINELNAHNQYISFLLKSGTIGLFVYLWALFVSVRIAVRERAFLFLSFLTIVIVVSISENILDINKGVFFFSFFLSLFYFSSKQIQTGEESVPVSELV